MLRQIRVCLRDDQRVVLVPDVDVGKDGWSEPLQLKILETSNPDVVELVVREQPK